MSLPQSSPQFEQFPVAWTRDGKAFQVLLELRGGSADHEYRQRKRSS
jgi:hypothetical protein